MEKPQKITRQHSSASINQEEEKKVNQGTGNPRVTNSTLSLEDSIKSLEGSKHLSSDRSIEQITDKIINSNKKEQIRLISLLIKPKTDDTAYLSLFKKNFKKNMILFSNKSSLRNSIFGYETSRENRSDSKLASNLIKYLEKNPENKKLNLTALIEKSMSHKAEPLKPTDKKGASFDYGKYPPIQKVFNQYKNSIELTVEVTSALQMVDTLLSKLIKETNLEKKKQLLKDFSKNDFLNNLDGKALKGFIQSVKTELSVEKLQTGLRNIKEKAEKHVGKESGANTIAFAYKALLERFEKDLTSIGMKSFLSDDITAMKKEINSGLVNKKDHYDL